MPKSLLGFEIYSNEVPSNTSTQNNTHERLPLSDTSSMWNGPIPALGSTQLTENLPSDEEQKLQAPDWITFQKTARKAILRLENERERIREEVRVLNRIIQQPEGFDYQFMTMKLEQIVKIEVELDVAYREIQSTSCHHTEIWERPHIETLPPEILSEVFLACVYMSTDGCPYLLCSVSAKWRQIAHALPNLWTRLTIRGPVTATAFFQRIHHHFGLSGDAPLTLTIQCRIAYLPGDVESQASKTIFSSGSHYWRRVKVLDVNYEENYDSTLIHDIMRNTSCTRTLTLRTGSEYFGFHELDINFKFTSVRRLRLLLFYRPRSSRHGIHQDMSGFRILDDQDEDTNHPRLCRYFELDRMTELTLLGFRMSHTFWLNFMRTKTASLQRASFTLDNSEFHPALSQSRQLGIVPNLHTLSVAMLRNTAIAAFGGLSFPSLRNLTFMAYDDYDRYYSSFDDELIYDHGTISSRRIHKLNLGPGIWDDYIACFTDIDAPMLEILYIRDVEITDTQLVSLMQNLPNLRSFTARTVLTDFRPLVEALCDSVLNSGDFLPRITRIVLQDQYHPWVDEASFQRISGQTPCPR